jgi:hypothetical protein
MKGKGNQQQRQLFGSANLGAKKEREKEEISSSAFLTKKFHERASSRGT